MAIHIDIYAHLNKQKLIKEGEDLKKYINQLERQLNDRTAKGAEGLSKQIIASNDRAADSYDRAANAIDNLIEAKGRLEDADKSVLALEKQLSSSKKRSAEDTEKLEDQLTAARKERARAEKDLVYKLQAVNKATRDETRAKKEAAEETAKYTKNLRDVAKITKLNRQEFTQLSRTTNRLRRETESLHDANIHLVKDNIKVIKSMESLGKASKNVARAKDAYKELQGTAGVTAKQLKRQGRIVADAIEAEGRAARDTRLVLAEIIQQRQDHIRVTDRSTDALRALAKERFGDIKRMQALQDAERVAISNSAELRRSFQRGLDAAEKARRELRKYTEMQLDSSTSAAALKVQIQKTNDAFEAQRRAVGAASDALGDYYRKEEEATRRQEEAARRQAARDRRRIMPQSIGQYAARNVGALTPLGTLSPSALIPVAAVLGTVGEAAVTASQSLALIPAGITAAVAGIGTLTVGMWGFGDALQGMSDPKKFAEALYTLSPNAQQAALSIKNLVDGPLGDLKRATQDALFANVSPVLQQLAQTLGPTIQRMTTSIATSFNQMFTGMSMQFMTPEMQQRVSAIGGNIAAMFDRIRPGMMAFTDAFMRIAETGSGFLPQMADGFSRLMITFDNFIARAQADGSLQNFMQRGIDAVAALSRWLLQFGQDIYEVFGNKKPEEFISMLNRIKNFAVGLMEVFVGVAAALEKILPIISGVVEALGGWENVMYGVITGGILMGLLKFVKWGKEFLEVMKLIGPAAALGGAQAGTALAAAGTAAGTGFASKIKTAIKGAGWVGLGIGIATAIEEGIRSFKSSNNSDTTNSIIDSFANGFDPGKVLNPSWWLEQVIGPPPGRKPSDASGAPDVPGAPSGPVQGPGIPGVDMEWRLDNLFGDIPTGPLFAGPNVLLDENGKALSDSDAMNVYRNQVPRDQYAVDPFTDPITGQKLTPMLPMGPNGMPQYPAGGVPGTPSIRGPIMPQYNSFGQLTGYGANMVDPEEVFDAQLAVINGARVLEEAKKDLIAAQMSGLASAEEINDLEGKVISQKISLHKSLVQLGKAQTGDVEKLKTQADRMSDVLGDFGAQIDKDFGISKGLPGIAENITKFLANLAFAPVFGAIRGAQAGLGFPRGEGVGSGLTGMAASNMGYYKGGPLDPEVQAEARAAAQAQAQNPGYTPTYRDVSGDTPGSSNPNANLNRNAYAAANPTANSSLSAANLRLNPNNVATAGLKPQSMALLGLIQGMPQFAKVPLTSAKLGREGDPYPWHGHGQGLDFGLDASIPEQSALGDQLKTFLESNKEMFGINHVLWKTMQGGNHFNHLHVGLNGSSIGKPDTSPLLQALSKGGALQLAGMNSTSLASLGSGIPIPLPVTIVGGSVGAGAGITPPPVAGPPAPAAPKSNSPLPVPAAGKPGGPPGSTGSMKDEQATKVWTVNPDGSISWRAINGNPTAAPKGQPGRPATTPPAATPPMPGGPSFVPPGLQSRMPSFARGGEVPIMAHSGEHVLTREDVAALGGQAGVYNFRRSLHSYEVGGAIPRAPFSPDPFDPSNVPDPFAGSSEVSGLGSLLGVGDSAASTPPKPPSPPAAPTPPPVAAPPPVVEPPAVPVVPDMPAPAQIPETALPGGVETPGTVIGAQVEAPEGYGQGFSITGGGLVGLAQSAVQSAVSAAGMAGDMAGGMGGGTAAAAVLSAGLETAMKLANRGIEYGAQVAGIGVQGMLETFLPAGGSELASNNWLTRFAGGIAGAAPAIANLAGGANASNQSTLAGVGGPPTPEQIAAQGMDPNRSQHTGAGAPAGPYTGVNIQNYIVAQNEDRAGQDLARYQPAPGMR